MGLSIILILYVHTSLAPALSQMVAFFDSDYGTVSWVLTAYLVSGATVTIVIGRLADIYGAKKMMLLVFLCYIVGTVFGGFAQDISTLLIFRVIQGVAVALVPIAIRIARDLFPKEKFPFAQGVILAMYQGGSAIGLVLGAAVVYFGGWQWVFYSAIPFAFMFFFLLWKFIPKSSVTPRVSEDTGTKDTKPKGHGSIIDIPGVITLTLTVSTFMLAITFLGKGSSGIGLFWLFLVIGVASIIAFFMTEKRSKIPLISLKLAFHRIIRIGNISYLMLGIIQYIIFSTIPTLGQTVAPYGLGMSILEVGLLQLPQALVFVALGPIAGILAVRYGRLEIYRSWLNYTMYWDSRTTGISFNWSRGCQRTHSFCCRWSILDFIGECDHVLYSKGIHCCCFSYLCYYEDYRRCNRTSYCRAVLANLYNRCTNL